MWFEGGPLHGLQREKTNVGRWITYMDDRGEPLRTVDGDSRMRARLDGRPVTFYKLDRESAANGRIGRVYTFCTLLEERARAAEHDRARAEREAALAEARATGEPPSAVAFAEPV